MTNIIYKEKDDSISWDEIQHVIYRSHESNRENGVDIRNAHLSPEEISTSIGSDGKCYVALDNNHVVGTCSIAFKDKNTWYAKGKTAYMTLEAVLPEYKGNHIFKNLSELRNKYLESIGCNMCYMNVAEHNHIRRQIAKREGFIPVGIYFNPYNPHNYLTYCRWFIKPPFSIWYIKYKYYSSLLKLLIKK